MLAFVHADHDGAGGSLEERHRKGGLRFLRTALMSPLYVVKIERYLSHYFFFNLSAFSFQSSGRLEAVSRVGFTPMLAAAALYHFFVSLA